MITGRSLRSNVMPVMWRMSRAPPSFREVSVNDLRRPPIPVTYVVYPGHEPQPMQPLASGKKPWWRREWFVLPAGVMVGIVIASLRASNPSAIAPTSARPSLAGQPVATAKSTAAPKSTVAPGSSATHKPVPAVRSATTPSGAKRSTPTIVGTPVNGTGVYLVGVDIPPGTYWTAGSDGCYWARLSDTSGAPDAVIANDITAGPTTVTIEPTDGVFETRGCAVWTLRR
jgi:hypothetical protein